MDEVLETVKLEDDCKLRHSGAVEYVWSRQHQPSAVLLAGAREALEMCLRDAGLAVPDEPSSAELSALASHEAFWPCANNVAGEFGIPGFAG